MKIISKFKKIVVYGCHSFQLNHIPKLFFGYRLASCKRSIYAEPVQCKITELALVGYEYLAHTVRLMGFFCMRNISMHSHFMAKLEGDTFECASYLDYWSTNPFQLCHLYYLVVIGKASKSNLGAH